MPFQHAIARRAPIASFHVDEDALAPASRMQLWHGAHVAAEYHAVVSGALCADRAIACGKVDLIEEAHQKIEILWPHQSTRLPKELEQETDELGTLVGLEGAFAGRAAVLTERQIRIGSDPSLELCVPDDPRLSPLHAGMIRQGGTWFCFDLQSETGTFVDGRRIENKLVPLNSGAVVTVGGQVFRIDYEPAARVMPIRTNRAPKLRGPRLEFS